MRTIIATLLLSTLFLSACTSGPAAELQAEAGAHTAGFTGIQTVKVEPIVMPSDIEGWKPGSAWRIDMASEGAASFAEGINDADGKLTGSTTAGELIVVITATRVNNGDKGGHYFGANPEAFLEAECVVKERDGKELARLRGKSRIVGYRGSAWPDLCYRLGEEFDTWFESQR